jgi:hypothetical protein
VAQYPQDSIRLQPSKTSLSTYGKTSLDRMSFQTVSRRLRNSRWREASITRVPEYFAKAAIGPHELAAVARDSVTQHKTIGVCVGLKGRDHRFPCDFYAESTGLHGARTAAPIPGGATTRLAGASCGQDQVGLGD